jgi:hypothetical protein
MFRCWSHRGHSSALFHVTVCYHQLCDSDFLLTCFLNGRYKKYGAMAPLMLDNDTHGRATPTLRAWHALFELSAGTQYNHNW